MSKYALILGSKSGIARAVAREFAQQGFNLYLAGRKAAAEIEPDVKDLEIRYSVTAKAIEFDAVAYDSHQAIYDALDPKPEVVICAVGYLADQDEAIQDLSKAFRMMEVNFQGSISMLEIAAADMEQRKSGVILGISSVAGDRGRASNYFYGAAKAGYTAYLSGLRNRLYASGVHVVTVKPGFVRTKMTEGMSTPGPITGEPEKVAKDMYKAYKKRKNTLYTLWMWKWIMRIITSIPEFLFKRLKL